ncbi:GxxExxY protein, partial [bacterium]|nr:GxxExxY protein [bacterium]
RHKLDLVVESRLIVELKTVEDLSKAHNAQVRSYLKAAGLTTGFLLNFSKEKSDFRRIDASASKSLANSPPPHLSLKRPCIGTILPVNRSSTLLRECRSLERTPPAGTGA